VPSATMVSRLLDLAEQMLREGARSPTLKRRAVSTAYYAVFHALAKSCASILLPSIGRHSEIYERVYRALDHGPLKSAFVTKGGALDRRSLRSIGDLVIALQTERHKADYLPPRKGIFAAQEVEELIDQARQAVREIEALGDEDRIALATSLLFKSRPS
jgi:uncharacterized protein (UPF0332 family)